VGLILFSALLSEWHSGLVGSQL